MSTATATMALLKAVDADNAEAYLAGSLAATLDLIDAHTHGGGALGKTLATNANPTSAILPAPVITGHEHVSGAGPTVVAQAALGGGTAVVSGSDGHHVLILTPAGGGGLAAGVQAVVTFNAVFANPHVSISPHGNPPPGAGAYTAAIIVGGYSIRFDTVGIAGLAYTLYVTVVDLG